MHVKDRHGHLIHYIDFVTVSLKCSLLEQKCKGSHRLERRKQRHFMNQHGNCRKPNSYLSLLSYYFIAAIWEWYIIHIVLELEICSIKHPNHPDLCLHRKSNITNLGMQQHRNLRSKQTVSFFLLRSRGTLNAIFHIPIDKTAIYVRNA